MEMGRALEDCRVLVADDEPLIAMALAEELSAAGAVIVGPASTLESAMTLLTEKPVDVAVLDVMLGEQLVYPLVDSLAGREVPYVFATGYLAETVPGKYARAPICGKPFADGEVVEAIMRALSGRA